MTRIRATIALLEWDVYYLTVDAASKADALAIAQANLDAHGHDDWQHVDDGSDPLEVIAVRKLTNESTDNA